MGRMVDEHYYKTISQMQFIPVISSEARNLKSETGLHATISDSERSEE